MSQNSKFGCSWKTISTKIIRYSTLISTFNLFKWHDACIHHQIFCAVYCQYFYWKLHWRFCTVWRKTIAFPHCLRISKAKLTLKRYKSFFRSGLCRPQTLSKLPISSQNEQTSNCFGKWNRRKEISFSWKCPFIMTTVNWKNRQTHVIHSTSQETFFHNF